MGESTGISRECEQKIRKRVEWQTQRRAEALKDYGPASHAIQRIDAYVAALRWVLEIGGASAKLSSSGRLLRDDQD